MVSPVGKKIVRPKRSNNALVGSGSSNSIATGRIHPFSENNIFVSKASAPWSEYVLSMNTAGRGANKDRMMIYETAFT